MQIIVAAAENWAIGKDGDLLWHLPEDMKFFRNMTTGNVVVMGRKTLDSFPGGKPLKDRRNLVLTQNQKFSREGTQIVHSVEEALEVLKAYEDGQIFIAGGGHIYREFLPFCHTAYVTKVYRKFEADTFFPNLDENPQWELSYQGEMQEWKGISFAFTTYRRK
ncbi:MAG: dihydrofolate reductase [Lachnospiraceae bacterium]|nr:dihydrofolate reductase [Lachnospiraceae bacterium]